MTLYNKIIPAYVISLINYNNLDYIKIIPSLIISYTNIHNYKYALSPPFLSFL
jgi:hypothetical protein